MVISQRIITCNGKTRVSRPHNGGADLWTSGRRAIHCSGRERCFSFLILPLYFSPSLEIHLFILFIRFLVFFVLGSGGGAGGESPPPAPTLLSSVPAPSPRLPLPSTNVPSRAESQLFREIGKAGKSPIGKRKKKNYLTHRCVGQVHCECRNDDQQGAELGGSGAECPEEHGALSACTLTAENTSPVRLSLEFSAKNGAAAEPQVFAWLLCRSLCSVVSLKKCALLARRASPTTYAPRRLAALHVFLAASPVCQSAHKNPAD